MSIQRISLKSHLLYNSARQFLKATLSYNNVQQLVDYDSVSDISHSQNTIRATALGQIRTRYATDEW